MEQPSAVEKQIGELEVAVDRLRSLYEQYFMGIEKIEPMVPRKDVDRRIYTVRKEQIRNTALRFRFQMILQRYNTYQTHWQRICREIENGTFKRHLARAKKRFASSRPPPPEARPLAREMKPEPGAAIAAELAAELAELDREFESAEFQIDVEVEAPVSRLKSSVPPAPAVSRGPFPPRPLGSRAQPPPTKPPSDPPPGLTALAPPLPPPLPPRPPPGPPMAAPLPPPRPRAPSVTTEGRPLPPPRPRAASVTTEGRPLPPPTRAPGPPAAAPLPPRPAPTPPHQAAAPRSDRPAPEGLPEARMKQLYAQLVEAKRRQNESTAAVTYQSVAKSLRESGEKLREKHGRAVDFEVTIKDGRAVIRPVIK